MEEVDYFDYLFTKGALAFESFTLKEMENGGVKASGGQIDEAEVNM